MDDMDDIIQEFLVESYENLDRLDLEFVELEGDPTSEDLLASIFRTIHTIKGTSGFFGFSHLEKVSHAGETLLSLLRDRDLDLDVDKTNALLAMVDAIRSILGVVESDGTDGTEEWADLTAELHRQAGTETKNEPADDETDNVDEDDEAKADDGHPIDDPSEEQTQEQAATPAPPVTETAPSPETSPAATTGAEDAPAHSVDASIRVDVKLLDRLMNLVGELVLARNQVLQYQPVGGDIVFQATSQQLDLITTELQESVMQTRMQPIGNVWMKFPRIVRDLATSLNKPVELEMIGKETELDKTLIEAIKDPLTHIVRNSVDHGIEMPDIREAAGKPATGNLTLRAFHEGGQVIIEISDDGAGLDIPKIRAKAISQGLVTEQRGSEMSDREAANLIFAAGFSTADKVTNVSGRGVGMDVVRTNVERIGGTLDLASAMGEGTTLTIKIPLTLAIIPALIISCDSDRYLIPQVNLVEVLHLDPDSASSLEQVGDAEVFRLRGRLLPVVHLRDVLGLARAGLEHGADDDATPEAEATQDVENADDSDGGGTAQHGSGGVSIVVLQADGQQFGLVVDQINDTEEIVVKPLSAHLKTLDAFAGTTIMGDGAVALILDAIGIARGSGVVGESKHAEATDEDDEDDDRRSKAQTVLVCRVGADRIAIPLALVSRLEDLSVDLIERAAGRDVIQYRGRILNLIDLGDALNRHNTLEGAPEKESLSVLVYEADDHVYGFVVDEILDVFDADSSDAEPSDQPGLAFSGVVGNRVTDMLNIDELIEMHHRTREPVLVGGG